MDLDNGVTRSSNPRRCFSYLEEFGCFDDSLCFPSSGRLIWGTSIGISETGDIAVETYALD